MGSQRNIIGALVEIGLGDGQLAFGRIISKAELAFYDVRLAVDANLDLELIYNAPIAFVLSVINSAVKKGRWKIVDKRGLEPEFLQQRKYFIKDALTGAYSIYFSDDGSTVPATKDECSDLERAAVWEPEHVEDRLRDHFAGKKNQWVEQLRCC